ncbi:AI-2E family transporter [Virgisporangium aurantiacum]|uniref:AI-2E family transporter n=1 Tax=Virgisporangium aurantiacum TaxID=175570 RepID=A0A8J3Z3I4_9ACTN|nr:AI-2E family transporter [Virgisporangium aurantiacum]GIJ54383.1 AI-2E family transporter [Virgisporangium aurantiacum]
METPEAANTIQAHAVDEDAGDTAPAWVAPLIRRTIWRVVWTGLGLAVLLLILSKARGLIGTLIIAVFFAVAMDPAVTYLHARFRWRRGAATGIIFAAVAGFFVALVTVLIPGMIEVTGRISDRLPGWLDEVNRRFGVSIGDARTGSEASEQLKAAITDWLTDNSRQVLGLAATTVGLLFQLLTVAAFTYYFTADAPRIRRAILMRLPPAQQKRLGWAWDTAIHQTGAYFYSRLILMGINGGLFFFVLLAVGIPWLIALPLALFEGFVAEFIPAIGTYIGAVVPIVVTLGIQGPGPALILVGWICVYQLVENYWLAPRLSARTMEINGGVAFGAALAGGAIGGPMGAFMALPVAALITSFLTEFTRRYPLEYHSVYDRAPASPPRRPTVTD